MAIPLIGSLSTLNQSAGLALESQKYLGDSLVRLGKTIGNAISERQMLDDAAKQAPFMQHSFLSAFNDIAAGDITGGMGKAIASVGQFAGNPILARQAEEGMRAAGLMVNAKLEEFQQENANFRTQLGIDAYQGRTGAKLDIATAREIQKLQVEQDQLESSLQNAAGQEEAAAIQASIDAAKAKIKSLQESTYFEGDLPVESTDTAKAPSLFSQNELIPAESAASKTVTPDPVNNVPMTNNQTEITVPQASPTDEINIPPPNTAGSEDQANLPAPNVKRLGVNTATKVEPSTANGASFIIGTPETAALAGFGLGIKFNGPQIRSISTDTSTGKMTITRDNGADEVVDAPIVKDYLSASAVLSSNKRFQDAISSRKGAANAKVEFVAAGPDQNGTKTYRVKIDGYNLTERSAEGIKSDLTIPQEAKESYEKLKSISTQVNSRAPIKGGGNLVPVPAPTGAEYDDTNGELPKGLPQSYLFELTSRVLGGENIPKGLEQKFPEKLRRNLWDAFDEVVKERNLDDQKLKAIRGDKSEFDKFNRAVEQKLDSINAKDAEIKKIVKITEGASSKNAPEIVTTTEFSKDNPIAKTLQTTQEEGNARKEKDILAKADEYKADRADLEKKLKKIKKQQAVLVGFDDLSPSDISLLIATDSSIKNPRVRAKKWDKLEEEKKAIESKLGIK